MCNTKFFTREVAANVRILSAVPGDWGALYRTFPEFDILLKDVTDSSKAADGADALFEEESPPQLFIEYSEL